MATRKALSKRTRFEVMKRDGHRCRYCGATSLSVALEIDHVVAVSNGGTNAIDNLVTACAPCNAGKSNVPLHNVPLRTGAEIRSSAVMFALDAVLRLDLNDEERAVLLDAIVRSIDGIVSYWPGDVMFPTPPATVLARLIKVDAFRPIGEPGWGGSYEIAADLLGWCARIEDMPKRPTAEGLGCVPDVRWRANFVSLASQDR